MQPPIRAAFASHGPAHRGRSHRGKDARRGSAMRTTDRHWSLRFLVRAARARLWLVVAGLVLAMPTAGVQGFRATEPNAPSPAEGHAEVIAQGVVRMPPTPVAWRAVARKAPVTPDAARPDDLGLGFVLADA